MRLLGCTLQAYSPALSQLQDRRRSPESATQTSVAQWMGELTRLKQGPRVTAHSVPQKVGRTWHRSCSWGGEGGIASHWGNYIRLAYQLAGKLGEGHAPQCPFDKNNHLLGSGASKKEGQSCEQDVGEAVPGPAGDVQRAREQPS